MTYGEYYYLVKYDMRLKNGVWVTSKPKMTIPTRMPKKDALVYYTNKFRLYWKSIDMKKQIKYTGSHSK